MSKIRNADLQFKLKIAELYKDCNADCIPSIIRHIESNLTLKVWKLVHYKHRSGFCLKIKRMMSASLVSPPGLISWSMLGSTRTGSLSCRFCRPSSESKNSAVSTGPQHTNSWSGSGKKLHEVLRDDSVFLKKNLCTQDLNPGTKDNE